MSRSYIVLLSGSVPKIAKNFGTDVDAAFDYADRMRGEVIRAEDVEPVRSPAYYRRNAEEIARELGTKWDGRNLRNASRRVEAVKALRERTKSAEHGTAHLSLKEAVEYVDQAYQKVWGV